MQTSNNSSDPRRVDKIVRVINPWNRLPTEAINAKTLLQFKIELEKILRTMGRPLTCRRLPVLVKATREMVALRYKPPAQGTPGAPGEDPTTDYMNVLGMIFSMCGLMMRLKWCAWVALYCSCISFANSRVNDDTKQMLSSFMLSISAVVMSYLQNPQPMTPPWSNI